MYVHVLRITPYIYCKISYLLPTYAQGRNPSLVAHAAGLGQTGRQTADASIAVRIRFVREQIYRVGSQQRPTTLAACLLSKISQYFQVSLSICLCLCLCRLSPTSCTPSPHAPLPPPFFSSFSLSLSLCLLERSSRDRGWSFLIHRPTCLQCSSRALTWFPSLGLVCLPFAVALLTRFYYLSDPSQSIDRALQYISCAALVSSFPDAILFVPLRQCDADGKARGTRHAAVRLSGSCALETAEEARKRQTGGADWSCRACFVVRIADCPVVSTRIAAH